MRILYGTHPAFWWHETGPNHPEQPVRLDAIDRGIRSVAADLVLLEAPEIDRELLHRHHSAAYIGRVEALCRDGGGALDPDTVAGPKSWEAALRAAGAGPAAVSALREGRADFAFLSVRPPGHHAGWDRAMGFCLFNNVGVTARLLADEGERVAIVDWDVHHGNGTQESFFADPSVLYVSTHEFPLYPGTGWVDEVGEGRGLGTNLNVPFPAGTGGDAFRSAFEELIGPVVTSFAPDWLLISCGYDAHASDPLARLRLLPSDYARMAAVLAAAVPPKRLIVFLEGGYDLEALELSCAATVSGLIGVAVPDEADRPVSPERAWLTLSLARNAAEPHHEI